MPSACALGIIQGNITLDFGRTERLRALRSTIFTRKVAEMRCIFPSQPLSRKSVWSAPQSLSGQRPSICLRRPLCRLKAPLGLSLLRKCGHSKREIKNDFPLKMPRATRRAFPIIFMQKARRASLHGGLWFLQFTLPWSRALPQPWLPALLRGQQRERRASPRASGDWGHPSAGRG